MLVSFLLSRRGTASGAVALFDGSVGAGVWKKEKTEYQLEVLKLEVLMGGESTSAKSSSLKESMVADFDKAFWFGGGERGTFCNVSASVDTHKFSFV